MSVRTKRKRSGDADKARDAKEGDLHARDKDARARDGDLSKSGRMPSIKGDPRDLGFGSVVTGTSGQRFLNQDGSFNVRRTGLGFWSSLNLYHSLLTISWTRFFLVVFVYYIIANALFAAIYLLCGANALAYQDGADVSRAWQAFFFSVATFATIGYGNITPSNFASNIVVVFESLFGLLSIALVTGILFARFALPTAKFIFSSRAVIAPYQEITSFQFRITNARRQSQIIELEAQVLFARFIDEDGRLVRRFDPLKLERQKVSFFPLHWTIVHPIDEQSPMHGLTHEDLQKSDAEFLILLTGFDETFSQTVHTRSSYKPHELVWNARFANIFNPPDGTDRPSIDVRKLHKIEKVTSDK